MLPCEANSAEKVPAPIYFAAGRVWLACTFFAWFFVFIWWFVDPQLFYHGDMVVLGPNWWITFPLFQTGGQFFLDQLREPGGLSAYLASLMAQYFYYPAVGALAVTLVAVVLFAGTCGLSRALRTTGGWTFCYVPPLVLMAATSAYAFQFSAFVAVTLTLPAIMVFKLVTGRAANPWMALLAYVVLSSLVFWTVGAVYFLFALGCILIELRRTSRRTLTPLYAVIAVTCVIGGTYAHLMTHPDEGFLFSWRQLAIDVFRASTPALSYAVLVAVMLAWTHRRRRTAAAPSQPIRSPNPRRERVFRATLATAVLAGASLLASFGFLDYEAQTLLRANYLARTRHWAAVLETLQQHPLPAYPPCLLYDINRALYETGQMPSGMFSFPQDPQFLIQVGESAVPYRGCQELLLALGCVNEAEHTAYESLEVRGPRPQTLRDLATINIVKGRPGAARVFLNVLSRDVIYGTWARDCLQRLAIDPRLDLDSEITGMRRVMLEEDRVAVPPHELLKLLLEKNPQNRMAFEYLMAHYLLTCQVDKIVANLGQLQLLGYESIPPSYAEATLLDWRLTGREPDLGGGRIDPETADRFSRFVRLTRQPGADQAALAAITGGTYFEYFFAHHVTQP